MQVGSKISLSFLSTQRGLDIASSSTIWRANPKTNAMSYMTPIYECIANSLDSTLYRPHTTDNNVLAQPYNGRRWQ
jgi:hypothetical protein